MFPFGIFHSASIGEWSIEPVFPGAPPIDERGIVSFEWMEGREFVVER